MMPERCRTPVPARCDLDNDAVTRPIPRMPTDPNSRRRFLAFLAGSPLLAAAGLDARTFAALTSDRTNGDRNTLDLVSQVAASQ